MAATDMYVTTTGAGTKSGLTWANAFSLTEFETDVEGFAEAGDRYFIKEGTYTFTADIISALDGTSASPIEIIGVVSATTAEPPTSSDWATGTNRPLFTEAAYTFELDNYWRIRNMRFTGTAALVVNMDDYSLTNNCYFQNTSGTANRTGLRVETYSNVVDCECISTNGKALDAASNTTSVIGCYLHDSNYGVQDTIGALFSHCIIDTCTYGIRATNGLRLFNTVIYNCPTGIYSSYDYGIVLLNNVFDNCTNAFKANNGGTVYNHYYIDYNNWSNNTKDMTWDFGSSEDNSAKGPNDTADTPNFTNAAGGDFSLNKSSALIDTGFAISLGVG